MALWLIRAGQHGQFEQRFLEDNRAYLTWGELDQDLGKLTDRRQPRHRRLSSRRRTHHGVAPQPRFTMGTRHVTRDLGSLLHVRTSAESNSPLECLMMHLKQGWIRSVGRPSRQLEFHPLQPL